MSRDVNDPRVVMIVAALDRAEQCDGLDGTEIDLLATVAGSIVDAWGSCPERWYGEHGWTIAGIRAFVLAYATNCPDDELDDAADEARKQIAWAEWYDAPGGGRHRSKCIGCSECEQQATVQP